MHSDDLVAEDIVAGSQCRGDGHGPGVVVADQIGGCPCLGVEVDAGFVDLDPLERGLVDSRAGVIAGATVGYIGQDGTNVGVRPGGPVCVVGIESVILV